MEQLITLEQVSKSFSANAKPVLEDINLTINDGESIAILGPSGSGKSTLLLVYSMNQRLVTIYCVVKTLQR